MRSPPLQELVSSAVATSGVPGAAIAVSLRGRREFAAAGVADCVMNHPLTATSRFQIGCIAKLLTSLVILELAQSRRLDMDDPVGQHLEELRTHSVTGPVCIRHLLSHTSGYQGLNVADPTVRHLYTWDKLMDFLRSSSRLFPPGTVFNYEHTECVLLGEIAQRVTGRHIHDLYQSLIFKPLQIQCGDLRTDAALPAVHVAVGGERRVLRPGPACSFWDASLPELTLSLPDLVVLAEAVAGFPPHSVFHPETLAQARSLQISLPHCAGGRRHERIPRAFGFGCAQYAEQVFGHNGSARGQTCALRFDLTSGAALAVGLSAWQPHIRDVLCARLISAFGAGSDTAPPEPLAWNLAALTGRYTGALGSNVDVSHNSSGGLVCRVSSPVSRFPLELTLTRTPEGKLDVQSVASHLTIGFFELDGCEPACCGPDTAPIRGLMLGLNAYRLQDTLARPTPAGAS